MVGLLATTALGGHIPFDTTGYIEIAKDVYILNTTSNLAPNMTRPHNSTHCEESIYWDRGGDNWYPLVKDCEYLRDNLVARGSDNCTAQNDMVLVPTSGSIHIAFSGTCSFFGKAEGESEHVWIGFDDIRHMLNVTINEYSGIANDGQHRVSWITGEVLCESTGDRRIYWSLKDPTWDGNPKN
ncbi:hypothetical protein QBC40DRAFT_255618 [Triangularia verruculosa]|uniref:Ecp2 effector protein-like domain-containing protein n=1 Tax=Triangularia verruculosa TaxID=2587418 RepID=A0AAN6XE50_9PEZI|nr:hypothetical protein QBC40DRAFT_255618 [Triangularia verruculosa]